MTFFAKNDHIFRRDVRMRAVDVMNYEQISVCSAMSVSRQIDPAAITAITTDTTYTAQYKENEAGTTYTITWKDHDGLRGYTDWLNA